MLIWRLVLVSGISLGTLLPVGIGLAETEMVSQDNREIIQSQNQPRRRLQPTFFEEERRLGALGDTFLVDALDGSGDPFYRTGGEGIGNPDNFPKVLPSSQQEMRSQPRTPRGGPFGIFDRLP